MPGPFGSSQWMYSSGAGAFYGTEIDGSLRFDDDDSAYLNRTPSSAGNRRTWTFSAWVKRGRVSGSDAVIFSQYNGSDNNNRGFIGFDNGVNLIYRDYTAGSSYSITSSAVFRDPSAWYHIVVRIDSTQATNSNRARIYVNGEQITAFGTEQYFAQNHEGSFNRAEPHQIGSHGSSYSFVDAYIADVHFVDGQSLAPTSFGETKSGAWIPKAYSGSYGTNGFHLEFAGNANDSSGNGNNWTANNISSYDYVPDSPTNNFCTMNPLDFYSGGDSSHSYNFRQGNLSLFTDGNGDNTDYGATMGMSSGAWYFEMRVNNWGGGGDTKGFGLSDKPVSARNDFVYNNGSHGKARFFGSNDRTEGGGISSSAFNITYFDDNGSTEGVYNDSPFWENGSIYGLAFDIDNNTIKLYKNGTQYVNIDCNPNNSRSENTVTSGVADHDYPTSDLGAGTGRWFPILRLEGGTANVKSPADEITLNFGQDSSFLGRTTAQGNTDANGYGDFYYTPPSGHLAMCTANMPVAEGIDPVEDNSPQDHFTPLLYTGDGSSPRSVTGVGFAPDFVWIKKRNVNDENVLQNRAVGATKGMISNSTGSEFTITEGLKSFDSDGFTLGNNTNWNGSGGSFVSWNWKAGGAGSANSEGSVTTTSTSANTDAGFSIITWTGDGTLGHGLDQAPEMFIVKIRNTSGSWWVWHKDLDNTSAGYMQLNDSGNAERSNTSVWRNAYPATATTIDVNTGYLNYSTDTYLAYCFHSVEGFSSFGKYVGNGGSGGTSGYNGPFVYTGFKPAFVMVRNIDNGWNWVIWDSKRDPYNQVNGVLQPNNNSTEYDVGGYMSVDFLSNGFKIRSNDAQENGNGQSHIYMAFAENPFKYANAR
jgi:hypothetical protein